MTTLATNIGGAVLALEDDRDDCDLLRLLLRKAGLSHALQVYRDGEQMIAALAKAVRVSLRTVRPLLCFLDIKTASASGHDVLQWIRGQASLDRMPVVMLSSSEHPRDIQQAAQHGAQCYLAKYPQPMLLKQVICDAERFSRGTPAEECFCFPANLLLVRCRRLEPRPVTPPPRSAPPWVDPASGRVP